jgi:hypothetical protein
MKECRAVVGSRLRAALVLSLSLVGSVANATPHVDSIAPTTGIAGLDVTLTGTGFGASQSAGSVWLGDQSATVVSWSDTAVVATVAHGATSGVAKVSQGGWSNTISLSVIEAKLVPEVMSLVVGETRTVQVMNAATGAIVEDIPLTVSAPSVASVTTDNPPVLEALATGSATLSAGEATASLTVYEGPTLPTGTIRWTAPSDGSGFLATTQAIPSDNEDAVADVFTLQASGRVQALTANGTLSWTHDLPSSVSALVPDASGGALAVDWPDLKRLDPATGETDWTYSSEGLDSGSIAIRPDGTIVFIDYDTEEPFTASVVGVDPDTGAVDFTVPIENSTYDSDGGCEGDPSYGESTPGMSRLIVTASDTTALAYTVEHVTSAGDCTAGGVSTIRALKLVTIESGGSGSTQTLHTWSGESTYEWNEVAEAYYTTDSPASGGSPLTIIAPGDDSITLTWLGGGVPGYVPWCHGPFDCGDYVDGTPDAQTLTVADAGGIQSEVAIEGNFTVSGPMVAGEDGVVFTPVTMNDDYSPALAAIASDGSVSWTEEGYFEPAVATSDGGVIARAAYLDDPEQLAVFDGSGTPTFVAMGSNTRYSWTGDWYASVAVGNVNIVGSLAGPGVEAADSDWAALGGSPSACWAAALPSAKAVRDAITGIALGYNHSHNWLEEGGTTKCNLFVDNVLSEAKASPPAGSPRPGWRHIKDAVWANPATANQWAEPGYAMGCWKILPTGPDGAIAGDVIAESQNPHGHVGIVVGHEETASTDSCDTEYPGIIDIGTFGFRLSPVDNCRHSGMRATSLVRTFSCF